MAQTSPASEIEVSVERLPGSQAQISAQAPATEVDRALQQALGRLGRQVRLPGFRPGKAPPAVVERAVGWEAIRQEAVDQLLPTVYARALSQAELEPVASPSISEVVLERGEPFRFVASVVVRPEVTLGDYRTIRVPTEVKSVSEQDVEGTLAALRQRYAQLSDAGDREIRSGDVVNAELTMRHGDQVVGSERQLQSLDLDQGELLPGMAEQLEGAKAGDTVDITLTLPEEYSREELRGELVTITAEIKQVYSKEVPPLDDNLAAVAGHGDNLAELRQYVHDQLVAEGQAEAEREQENRVLERLMEMTRVEVPEPMIQGEIDHELRDLESRLTASGLSLQQLLESQGRTVEQFRGEQRQPAVDRVKLELALEEVARRENLSISDPELDQALGEIFDRSSGRETRARAREPLRHQLLLGHARRHLAELARGTPS